MPPTTLREAPAIDSFTPLSEHQAATPSTFFGTKPILHFHATSARISVPRSQISSLPIFTDAGAQSSAESDYLVYVVDAFVSSEYVTEDSQSQQASANRGLQKPHIIQ